MPVNKKERLEARLTREQKDLLQRATELARRNLTDFVVSSAQAAAEEAIRTHQIIELSVRETEAFVEAILNPRGPNEALKKAAKRYQDLVEKSNELQLSH